MTCTVEAVLYVGGTYPIIITLKNGNLTAANIDQMTITLTNMNTGLSTNFTKASGKVTIVSDVITLLISDSDITVAGIYEITVTAWDAANQKYTATPNPPVLQFFNQ